MLNINKTVDKIFNEKKDEEFKCIIKKFLNWSVGILIILVIILLCSIFGPEFEWGIVDRDILISVVPTVLGGYFGFVGAIIGIIGAYFMLKEQLNNEVKQINEKENIDLKMMKNLLEYTVSETDFIISGICNKYSELYSNGFGKGVLRAKLKKLVDNPNEIIEHLVCTDVLEYDKDILFEIYDEEQGNKIIENKNLGQEIYIDTYRDIHKIFVSFKTYKELVYDKSWASYLVAIKNSNKFVYDDIQAIIKWLTLLSSDAVEENKEKLEQLNKNHTSDGNGNIMRKIRESLYSCPIQKELINHICDFIYYRDYIISLIENSDKFGESAMSGEFDAFLNHMIESMILTEELKVTVNS